MSSDEQGSSIVSTLRRIGITAGIALVAAAVSGGYVWFDQRARAAEVAQGLTDQIEACQNEQRTLTAAHDQEARSADLLRVRMELSRAEMALERGNFGIAKDHVSDADALLRKAKDPSSVALADQLTKVEIAVTEDLQGMRTSLMAVAEAVEKQLDGAL